MDIKKQIEENGYKQTVLNTISQINEVLREYDIVRKQMKLLDEKEENLLRRIEDIFFYMQVYNNEIYESVKDEKHNTYTIKIMDGNSLYSIKQDRCYSRESIRKRINISSEKIIDLQ